MDSPLTQSPLMTVTVQLTCMEDTLGIDVLGSHALPFPPFFIRCLDRGKSLLNTCITVLSSLHFFGQILIFNVLHFASDYLCSGAT